MVNISMCGNENYWDMIVYAIFDFAILVEWLHDATTTTNG